MAPERRRYDDFVAARGVTERNNSVQLKLDEHPTLNL